jgi:HEAT repeat protein
MSSKKNSKGSTKGKVRHSAIAPKKTAQAVKAEISPETPASVAAMIAAPVAAPAKVASSVASPVADKSIPTSAAASPEVATTKPTMSAAELETAIGALRDCSAERAAEAADCLGKSGNRAAVEPLMVVLDNADGYFHPVSRAAGAMALGRLGDSRAIPALAWAIKDQSAEVSCEAILALGELKASSIVSELTTIVANDSGFYLNVTRHAAIRTLGRLGATEARATLETVAASPFEDPALVNAARQAIASL